MKTIVFAAVLAMTASAAFGAPRVWLEYGDEPDALMVSNDSGTPVPGCTVEWRIRYADGGHYTEIAMVDLPADGNVKVSGCNEWWDQRRSKTLDVWLTLYGPDKAVLAKEAYDGVFKVVARKGIPTDGWKAEASRGPNTVAAFDGDLGTRWDTGGRQQVGDWFTLDMGKAQRFSGLIVDARGSANDYPSGLKVSASEDGEKWETVADVADTEAVNKRGVLTLTFAPVTARYIKLEVTRPHGDTWFWSIHELSVLPAEGK